MFCLSISNSWHYLTCCTRWLWVCVVTFFTLPSIESNNSKCCPALPEAWVPANAGTHAEPLYWRWQLSWQFHFVDNFVNQLSMQFHLIDNFVNQLSKQFHLADKLANQLLRQFHLMDDFVNQLSRQFHLIDNFVNQLSKQFHLIDNFANQLSRRFHLVDNLANPFSRQFHLIDNSICEPMIQAIPTNKQHPK